jgi:hypothetical protein
MGRPVSTPYGNRGRGGRAPHRVVFIKVFTFMPLIRRLRPGRSPRAMKRSFVVLK